MSARATVLPRRAAFRRALAVGGTLVVATAAIGLLHTPLGRPVLVGLARLTGLGGGCPAARVTAAEVDRLRHIGLVTVRGTERAPARPALGFRLDETTVAEAEAWATRSGVTCTTAKHGLVSLHCQSVAAEQLPDAAAGDRRAPGAELRTIEDLALTFDPGGRLIAVDGFSRGVPLEIAAAVYAASTERLGSALARPDGASPEQEPAERSPTLAEVARTPLLTATRRFRFADYVAILSVSHLPSGIAVREQYLSGS